MCVCPLGGCTVACRGLVGVGRSLASAVRASVGRRNMSASVASDRGWSAVCSIEESRARAYLAKRGAHPPLSVPLPMSNHSFNLERRRAVVHQLRDALEDLLNSRGTLCSSVAPCRVQWTRPGPDGRGSRDGKFEICLPRPRGATLCEVRPSGADGFVLRKACAEGPEPRCFSYDGRGILQWANEIRQRALNTRRRDASLGVKGCDDCGPIPEALQRPLRRCAVVGAGHSLRCGLNHWPRLIDSEHYDAVWRANAYPRHTSMAGTRTDFAYHNCEAAPPGAYCMDDLNLTFVAIRPRMRMAFVRFCMISRACKLFLSSGLGWAHSGGHILDHAVAMCDQVDVFGMGLLSRGPGSDLLYQHYYDERIAPHCSHPCDRWGFPWNANASRKLCRPRTNCSAPVNLRGPPGKAGMWRLGVPLFSEELDDFFYLSELRLAVMHVLGLINWVWY